MYELLENCPIELGGREPHRDGVAELLDCAACWAKEMDGVSLRGRPLLFIEGED